MATETFQRPSARCPSCGKHAKRVSCSTLRALLKVDYLSEIIGSNDDCQIDGRSGCKPAAEKTGYRFCGAADCDVVYFAEETGLRFTKEQLRVPVGVKETAGERLLCYCFGHSVHSIKAELRTKGRSDAVEDIRSKMKAPGCRCETENPSGSCCLGSVAAGIETATKELSMLQYASNTPNPGRSLTSRREKFAMIGTVLSAVIASSCCWLPLVLLTVGISGIGIASALEAYRPLFIVITFGFLGAAFYFTYRPRRSADAGQGCCATEPTASDGCCETPKKPFSLLSLNKSMLWIVTALAAGFLLFPSYGGLLLGAGDEQAATTASNRAVLKVEGMTCEACAAVIRTAMRRVPGVLAVEVNYEKGEAVIAADACCRMPRDSILDALRAAGYSGTFVEGGAGHLVNTDVKTQHSDSE